jgi:hypothetical protein
VLLEVAPDARERLVALLAREDGGEVSHDLGVSVQGEEGVEIGVSPLAQKKALGLDPYESAFHGL